ncbi:4673_t:CDS:2, partial [Ambispora gerdemannii]
ALVVITVIIGTVFLPGKKDNKPNQVTNLGEQQRQQVREAASQLVGSILDNQNNFNQLTTNPDGSRRDIDEIEEVFLLGSLNRSPHSPTTPAPNQITSSLSFEVIEQTWYELRVFILAGLQNPNQSLIDNARLRIKNDIENELLDEYLKVIQELKTIKELFEKYTQIRTDLVINKVSRKDELIFKGYSEKDVEKLTEWGLLEQDFSNLFDEKRIGVTNTLSVYFPENIIEEQRNSVRQLIELLLDKSEKLGKEVYKNDIYILRVGSRDREGTISGPSSGIAHYLALYSALNNLLAQLRVIKLNKEGKEVCHKYPEIDSYEDIKSPLLQKKVKQVHFISQVDQIGVALQEILKEPEKKITHSCGKDEIPEKKPEKPEPREPPQKPEKPNSEITSEQLLSLATELSIREKGDSRDFWEKLSSSIQKNPNYQKTFQETLNLRKEYLDKLEKLQSNPNQRNSNQGKKTRKFVRASDGKILVKEEEVRENDKMTCEVCHQQFEDVKDEKIEAKDPIDPKPEEIEKKTKELYQEYENKFKKIASAVANLNMEILTNLSNLGCVIQKIN